MDGATLEIIRSIAFLMLVAINAFVVWDHVRMMKSVRQMLEIEAVAIDLLHTGAARLIAVADIALRQTDEHKAGHPLH